eukprot:2021132-Pleurochrysis_carterae.AAC.1
MDSLHGGCSTGAGEASARDAASKKLASCIAPQAQDVTLPPTVHGRRSGFGEDEAQQADLPSPWRARFW